jgi:NAD+ diphosphatase
VTTDAARLRDSTPAGFVPAVEPGEHARDSATGEPRGRCFAFAGGDLLVITTADHARQVPAWDDVRAWHLDITRHQYLGTLAGEPCWSAELAPAPTLPEGTELSNLRPLYDLLPDALYALAGRAAQIVAWDRDHQHCGRCGTPTEPDSGERARRCPACGLTVYPRLTPAIITLIERDERILLARGHAFLPGRYGIIAGFVEPGESLEDAVRREAREEVGLELGRVDYFGSQPWPFPQGIMIGFRASHLRGEITIDDAEIADADWYGIDNLPDIPTKLSIARRLIDDWAERKGVVIDRP